MDHQSNITESDLDNMLFDETAVPKPLPFPVLERITNGFSYKMEIGRGGFSVVYKAMLENGPVAVKRLTNTYKYENEFFREAGCLMKVKHKNIVRFLGYCVDTQGNMTKHEGKFVMADIQQRLLCFEYLPNGGLDGYIKDPSRGLNWRHRYTIIKGICEGVHHLHEMNIVHLDLKPANILLDENLEPKTTDFGISRSFDEDQTRLNATNVVGTMGYMAPEFLSQVITQKYDLYSLGVIIMEILTGKKGCEDVDVDNKKIYSFKLSDGRPVMCVKFIERKQWFAAAPHDDHFSIHVYSYETKMQKIVSIKDKISGSIVSLAVHPTRPYLVSMDRGSLSYWNWEKNWQGYAVTVDSKVSFKEGHQVAFSSVGTVACALDNCTVKVWNRIEYTLERTFKSGYHILSGHSGRVNCLDFITRADQEYLVTGSNDLTCKIWDIQKKICLHTLYFKSPVMSILYQPALENLITGSEDGSVHSWRTAGFRWFAFIISVGKVPLGLQHLV